MASTQILLSQNLQDLNPILAGWSFSDPGAQFQPEVINYTLLHYVASGHGKILTADGSYAVCAGQAFWIFPGDQVTHVADRDDPWVLRWVGFTGSLSHDFSQLPRVFSPPKQTLPYLKSLDHFDGDTAFELAADLLLLYTKLVRRDKIKPDYVQFVMDYVQSSYMHKLSVQTIADQLNLDRSYLARLFKKRTKQSIQGYILNVRLMEAKRYLMQGHSVKEAASMCGFNDVANFSKLFTREDGLSPQLWKKVVMARLAETEKKD